MGKISDIWQNFDKVSKYESKCKICKKIYKTSGNTTNLRTHLEKVHSNLKSAPVTQVSALYTYLCALNLNNGI